MKEIDLDLDGQGGRTFLRVLLYLCMHDYPSLVTGSLQLLFRHFSQRQEVLSAFKQVRNNKVPTLLGPVVLSPIKLILV